MSSEFPFLMNIFLSSQNPDPEAAGVSGKSLTGFGRLWIQTLVSKLRENVTQCSHNTAGCFHK